MKVLIVFKTSGVAVLISTLMFITYCCLKGELTSELGKRSSSYYPEHQWHLPAGDAATVEMSARITEEREEESVLASSVAEKSSLQKEEGTLSGKRSSLYMRRNETIEQYKQNGSLPSKPSEKTIQEDKRLHRQEYSLLSETLANYLYKGRAASVVGRQRNRTQYQHFDISEIKNSSVGRGQQTKPAMKNNRLDLPVASVEAKVGKNRFLHRNVNHYARRRPVVKHVDTSHRVPASTRMKEQMANKRRRSPHVFDRWNNTQFPNSQMRLPPEFFNLRENEAPAVSGQVLRARKNVTKKPVVRSLSPGIIHRIKKLVFFVGYPRSGHSIIGTLMDAHPHVVISNEFNLFMRFPELDKASNSTWRDHLYNVLYARSRQDARASRADEKKGYNLKVDGLWQGKFSGYIEVIGDKSGDITTRAYLHNRTEFLRNYKKLKSEVSIPLRIIHTVRNPFDMISTTVVITKENRTKFREMKQAFESTSADLGNASTVHKYEDSAVVRGNGRVFFRRIDTVMKLIEIFGRENVLDVHNCDLVADPRGTMARIFQFLDVNAAGHYLDTCAKKVFKSVSRSRNMVDWTSEQIEEVERRMKDYDVLRRYSFTSD